MRIIIFSAIYGRMLLAILKVVLKISTVIYLKQLYYKVSISQYLLNCNIYLVIFDMQRKTT